MGHLAISTRMKGFKVSKLRSKLKKNVPWFVRPDRELNPDFLNARRTLYRNN